jgi:hypothetical protein
MEMGLPFDLTWYKLLTDWGSVVGGLIALIAGGLAYKAGIIQAKATQQAADKQIAVNARKDRLQAHCIAVGIYPELLAVEVKRERASKIIQNEFPKVRSGMTTQIVATIRDIRIDEPPLISRSVDYLYVLEKAGATILQLLSVVLQYNSMVETLAKQIAYDVNSFDPATHQKDFSGHLRMMAQLLEKAEQEIKPIHDWMAD